MLEYNDIIILIDWYHTSYVKWQCAGLCKILTIAFFKNYTCQKSASVSYNGGEFQIDNTCAKDAFDLSSKSFRKMSVLPKNYYATCWLIEKPPRLERGYYTRSFLQRRWIQRKIKIACHDNVKKLIEKAWLDFAARWLILTGTRNWIVISCDSAD